MLKCGIPPTQFRTLVRDGKSQDFGCSGGAVKVRPDQDVHGLHYGAAAGDRGDGGGGGGGPDLAVMLMTANFGAV